MIDLIEAVVGYVLLLVILYGLYVGAWNLWDRYQAWRVTVLRARMEAMRVSQELGWLAWQTRLAMREEVRRHESEPDQS